MVVIADVWAYPSALFVMLCVSPLLMPAVDERAARAPRMSSGKGVFHAASIGIALVTTRHILIANLLPPLLGGETELSEATLLGASIVATAAATAPLPKTHFRNRRGLRQLHTFSLIIGVLMLAISPEVLEGESIVTSAFHAITDAAGASTAPTRHGVFSNTSLAHNSAGRWTSWLLLIALSLSAAVLTQILPLPRSLFARVVASCGIGGSLGLWLCGSFLPPSASIFGLIATSCTLVRTKHVLSEPFMHKNDLFAKTGSGQTWPGKHSKQVALFFLGDVIHNLHALPDGDVAHAHASQLRGFRRAVPDDVRVSPPAFLSSPSTCLVPLHLSIYTVSSCGVRFPFRPSVSLLVSCV